MYRNCLKGKKYGNLIYEVQTNTHKTEPESKSLWYSLLIMHGHKSIIDLNLKWLIYSEVITDYLIRNNG